MKSFILTQKFMLVTLMSCMFAISGVAGEAILSFKVVDENGDRLRKPEIVVFSENKIVRHEEPKSGKAKIKLPTGHYYTIEVRREDLVVKRIVVDTRSEEELYGKCLYTFLIELEDPTKYDDLGGVEDYLDYPVAIISLDDMKELTYSKQYMFSTASAKRELLKPNDKVMAKK